MAPDLAVRSGLRIRAARLLAWLGLLGASGHLAAAVEIDAAWLAANGPEPYVLDQADTTYVLGTDVTTVGTAFVVLAAGITLDLNGYTVTYGESAASTVANGGFEQGSGTSVPGWNLAGAPAAALVPNTTYLFGAQVLRMSNFSTPQTIVSSPVPITLAGHTYVATITPSGQIVEYGTVLTLEVVDTVTGAVLATGVTADQIQRGFSAVAPFTPTTTHPVKLVVTVTPPSGSSTTIDLDAATLTVSYDYGIIASGDWSGDMPGSGSGYANLPPAVQALYSEDCTQMLAYGGFTVTGGAIVQGQGGGSYSSPLFLENTAGCTVDQMTTYDSGLDTSNVDCDFDTGTISITGSSFTDAAPNVADRMAGPTTISLGSTSGTVLVQGNTVSGSPQCGIVCDTNNGGTLVIDGNHVSQNAVVADAAGIAVVSVDNFQITNNTVDPVTGEGIAIDGYRSAPSNNGVIQGNTVTTEELPNRETGLGEIARALRVRNDVDLEGPQTNIDISGNAFTTTIGPGYTLTGYAVWFSEVNNGGAMNNANLSLHDNHITCIAGSSDPSYTAEALVVDQMDPGIDLTFSNNILESNGISLGIGGYNDANINDLAFVSNTFCASAQGASRPYTACQVGFDVTQIAGVSIIDPILTQGATWTLSWTGSGTKALGTGWTLGVDVVDADQDPIPAATVTLANAAAATVFTGTTPASGALAGIPVVTLIQSQPGSDPTQITAQPQGPFVATASVGSDSANATVALSSPTTVTLTLLHTQGTVGGTSGSGTTTGSGGTGASIASGGGTGTGTGTGDADPGGAGGSHGCGAGFSLGALLALGLLRARRRCRPA